jgi:hypothetical protein
MSREEETCCCCELAVDLTLAAWETWSGCLSPSATAEEAAEQIAAMYEKIQPVVARHCRQCGAKAGE